MKDVAFNLDRINQNFLMKNGLKIQECRKMFNNWFPSFSAMHYSACHSLPTASTTTTTATTTTTTRFDWTDQHRTQRPATKPQTVQRKQLGKTSKFSPLLLKTARKKLTFYDFQVCKLIFRCTIFFCKSIGKGNVRFFSHILTYLVPWFHSLLHFYLLLNISNVYVMYRSNTKHRHAKTVLSKMFCILNLI